MILNNLLRTLYRLMSNCLSVNPSHMEAFRYIVNGIIATGIHFIVLWVFLNKFQVSSAGAANFMAAFFGIFSSFAGSRYFVFQEHTQTIVQQATKFFGLYAFIAILHGLLLYVLTDQLGINYRIGFLCATIMQVLTSYAGNKFMVFSK